MTVTDEIKPAERDHTTARPNPNIAQIERLHHYGYRCADARETLHFYEDILGLPLARVVSHDHIPSTGEYAPYAHLFFEMADGAHLAFFDIFDGKGSVLAADVPSWLHHIALKVADKDALESMKERLEVHGVEVLGPIKHSVMWSIYFYDPNGHRLELVANFDDDATAERLERDAEDAHLKLETVLKRYVPERGSSDKDAIDLV